MNQKLSGFDKAPLWRRIEWYFRQLLPLTYVSEYGVGDTHTGEYHKEVCVWNMWLGRSYNVRKWRIQP